MWGSIEDTRLLTVKGFSTLQRHHSARHARAPVALFKTSGLCLPPVYSRTTSQNNVLLRAERHPPRVASRWHRMALSPCCLLLTARGCRYRIYLRKCLRRSTSDCERDQNRARGGRELAKLLVGSAWRMVACVLVHEMLFKGDRANNT